MRFLLAILATTLVSVSVSASAPDNTVYITSADDHCIILPRDKHTTIGDSEHPGGMKSYCTNKYDDSQGQLPKKFWKNGGPNFKKTDKYVQLTGCINPGTSTRLVPSDGGGQYDSDGGEGGLGNPRYSSCLGYDSYVELVEPDVNRACIRCCHHLEDCDLNFDTQGCPAVISGDYTGCE